MKYATAPAFRRALEGRLKARAGGDGARIARDRKRSCSTGCWPVWWTCCRGSGCSRERFALDLWLADRARSTKDIDLAWRADEDEVLSVLIDAATHDLGDFSTFAVERTDDPPERFGGAHRFRVMASLAGRPFEMFVLDVGDAHEAVGVEVLTTPDLLGFAGIAPVVVPAIPIAVQVAEKLHAYTRVYEGGRVCSRSEDLVDLALITQLFTLDADDLRRIIEAVFAARATHEPPMNVPPPPEECRLPFRHLARMVGLDGDVDTGHRTVVAMLDPILDHPRAGTWSPDAQQWTDVAMR